MVDVGRSTCLGKRRIWEMGDWCQYEMHMCSGRSSVEIAMGRGLAGLAFNVQQPHRA